MARLWAFAATALILGPAFSYCFGLLVPLPIEFDSPLIALALLAVSVAFGLWGRGYSTLAGIGVLLWTIMTAWISPIVLFLILNFACGIQNSRAGHYVCGL
jgi:hypothetical protein